jgi:hypothetical protein
MLVTVMPPPTGGAHVEAIAAACLILILILILLARDRRPSFETLPR